MDGAIEVMKLGSEANANPISLLTEACFSLHLYSQQVSHSSSALPLTPHFSHSPATHLLADTTIVIQV